MDAEGIYRFSSMNGITPSVIVARMRGRPPSTPLGKPTNRLREWREYRGLSQQELADKAHTNNMTVSRHERGEAQIKLSDMKAYATALNISPEDLMPAQERMTDRMRTLVDLAAGMSPELQDQFIRLGRALAEPSAPFEGEPKGEAGRPAMRKKKQ